MRTTLLIVLILTMAFVLAACQRDRIDGLPPATPVGELPSPTSATSTGVPAEGPTVGVTPVLTTTPSAETTITVTVARVSPTPPMTVTVEAVARQALRIRSGPGLEYPIIGDLAATARVTVIARSPGGAWLRIECPAGLRDECWIIGDASYWDFTAEGPLPTSAAPPVPTVTPTPPCVVTRPVGWVSYSVVANDTLGDLAGRFSASVSDLRSANCLAGDMIVAGSSLYVPGGPAPASGSSATSAAAPASTGNVAAAASIRFGFPNESMPPCPDESDEPVSIDPATGLGIYYATGEGANTFNITDFVCIWVAASDPNQPVTVAIVTPDNQEISLAAPLLADGAWSFLLEPDMPASAAGEAYRIRVSQGGRALPDKIFTVTHAQQPTLRLVTWNVSPGGRARAVFANFRAGQRLYLYQLDLAAGEWRLLPDRLLRVLSVDPDGEGDINVATLAGDTGHCFLVDRENPQPAIASRYDKRVFAVGVSPKECN